MPTAAELEGDPEEAAAAEAEHETPEARERGASDTTDVDPAKLGGAPRPSETAPMPKERQSRRAALYDEVKAMREDLAAMKTAREKSESDESRQSRDSELAAMREELRATREEITRSATRRGADTSETEDKEYGDAIAKLRRDKWAAADRKDADGFDEAQEAISELQAARAARRAVAEYQASQPAPLPPEIDALEREYNDIQRIPGWRDTVVAWDRALGARGKSAGIARYREAFEQAAIALGVRTPGGNGGGKPSAAQAARSLATGGTSGGSAGGNGKSVRMPAGWEEVARKARMDPDEYKRIWVSRHPDMVEE